MPLKDILKKKDKSTDQPRPDSRDDEAVPAAVVPEFTFIRSDTHSQEIITPPDHENEFPLFPPDSTGDRKRHLPFRSRHRASSASSNTSQVSSSSAAKGDRPEHRHRRLSQRLGLKRDVSSSNVPDDLPEIRASKDGDDTEGQWEERATRLVKTNEINRSRSGTPEPGATRSRSGSRDGAAISSKNTDDNIQEAIRLHEAGQLEAATKMFGRLADPKGENNALSQVLYGLSLRHGWGCTADPAKAMVYLSAAASNAASIEDMALQAGQRKGGVAKGELTLAIFELANSFRHGWGVEKDPVAAKQYYETAANLGDTDAMNEVAWCYLEGFGCKKDKFAAAKYYRLAEKGGNKTVGNSWIWKPKYDPPPGADDGAPSSSAASSKK